MNSFAASWASLPEREVLPNNFRTAVAGREMGINLIRWIHPTDLPAHVHDDAEQALIVTAGRISFTIGGQPMELGVGDVAVIPRGVEHSGRSLSGEATFVEVFAPLRLENLLGFLGGASMPTLATEEGP